MKELTAEQIQELHKLVERNAIGHYDVEVEIVDHYASAIEEIWAEDPSVSFYQAQMQVYKEFWDFQGLVKDKRKVLYKQAKNESNKQLVGLLSWPKVIELIVLVIFISIGFAYFLDAFPNSYYYIGFGILLALQIFVLTATLKEVTKFEKSYGKSFLRLEAILQYYTFTPIILLQFCYSTLFSFDYFSNWTVIFFASCLAASLLLSKAAHQIVLTEIFKLKKQYAK